MARLWSTSELAAASRVRVAFDEFVGKTVYHCHILDHEDLGMIEILSHTGVFWGRP